MSVTALVVALSPGSLAHSAVRERRVRGYTGWYNAQFHCAGTGVGSG